MERKREELEVRNTLLILFMTSDRTTVCEQSEGKQGHSNLYWLLLQYTFVQRESFQTQELNELQLNVIKYWTLKPPKYTAVQFNRSRF